MNTISTENLLPAGVEAGLSEPSIAALNAGGAPVLAAVGMPFSVVWANDAAFSLFGVDDLETLTRLFQTASDPGFRRLRELAGSMLPGAPGRLERLRFFLDGHAQMITFLCKRTSAPAVLIAGAMGVRPKPRVRLGASTVALASALTPPATEASRETAAVLDVSAEKPGDHESRDEIRHDAPAPLADKAVVAALSEPEDILSFDHAAASPEQASAEDGFDVTEPTAAHQAAALSETIANLSDETVAGDEVEPTVETDFDVPQARRLRIQRDALAHKYGSATRLRFLWRTDASGRLTQMGEALGDVVGGKVNAFEGAPASALLEAFDADPQGVLSRALSGRETFSPIEINWPLRDLSATVPVTMGALPAFDRTRRFDGFKGFGVIHLDRLVETPLETEVREMESGQIPADVADAEANASEVAGVPEVLPEVAPGAETPMAALSVLTKGPDASGHEPGEEVPTGADVSLPEIDDVTVATRTIEADPPIVGAENDGSLLTTQAASHVDAPALTPDDDEQETISEIDPENEDDSSILDQDKMPVDEPESLNADRKFSAVNENLADEITAEDQRTDAEVSEPEAIARAETGPAGVQQDPLDQDSAASRNVPATASDSTERFAHATNVVALRPFQTRFQPVNDAPSSPLATPDASVDQPGEESATRPETELLPPTGNAPPDHPAESPGNDVGVSLTSSERNAFREIARALGAKVRNTQDIAAQHAKADARLGQSSEPQEAPGEQTREAVQAKRQETELSLARIRDLLQISSAVDGSAPLRGSTIVPVAAPAELALDSLSVAANAPALFDRLPLGILISRGGVPIHVNRHLLDALGYQHADDLYAAGGLDRMFRGREPGALTKEADGGAIPVVSADGEVSAFDVRIQSIDWGGEPASVMTFRRSGEMELQQRIKTLEMDARRHGGETRELHAILDTATDGVVVIDNDGRILGLNRSAEALFGYEQNEIAGENFRSLLSPESHSAAAEYLAGLKTNGVASVLNDGREVMGRARQGGPIPLFFTLGRIGAGDTSKFCAVLRDITHWKKAERELKDARREAERASALKSDFLAKISHEIRTPLNAILGFAEVIMEERFGPVGNDRYKDYLKDIHSSGAHVMSLVNDLLDLSKIEAGKVDLNFGAVDANKVINECVSLMQNQAVRERVIVRLALAPRLPHIVADERSLKQIVLNLLSNALKFNEPGGQVIISTALTDAGNAVLRIKDTGIGMTDAEVETALEPFRQVATSRQTTGTGLGLPLTKALVEANRASFMIKSKKREGTLVEVSFPSTRVLAE